MNRITLIGGGCAGPLMAIMLTRRGMNVTVIERRVDPRSNPVPAGRSINLALAARGMAALEHAEVAGRLEGLLVPMHGRMLHELDRPSLSVPYGQEPHEVLYSVSRAALHRELVTAAIAEGVQFEFGQACTGANFATSELHLVDVASGRTYTRPLERVIATDGAGSALRTAMVHSGLTACAEDVLAHRYKELTIPRGPDGQSMLDMAHLHIWPRSDYMLIALPNADGSHTATLFMSAEGPQASFAALEATGAARAFFEKQFPDAIELMPQFDSEYATHPVGKLSTIHTTHWALDQRLLLMGDSAHGIVPFHGQGLNCAFEDCVEFDRLMDSEEDWATRFAFFEARRKPHTDAIARMAIENYLEMRDSVREPRFLLMKALSLQLERRHPHRFIPRYSMVMFHAEIGYAEAERRGSIQHRLLDQATVGLTSLNDVDFVWLDAEIEKQLPPLSDAATF
jgi:kynurenine 3-monooxygenase